MTLPLSLPGVAAGALLVFIPAIGEFVIPDLLGGPDTLMIGKVLWDEFFENHDWPAAAAVATVLVAGLAVPIVLAQRLLSRRARRMRAAPRRRRASAPWRSSLGFAFLYAPIVLLVVYSFNASRLVTVWAGFSTRWYGALIARRRVPARRR